MLRYVEQQLERRALRLAVIGCADGKFVLPAARRGYQVLAVDIDGIALFGGMKTGPGGPTHMPGLQARLAAEGLLGQVSIRHSDLMDLGESWKADIVFSSGALQYSRNLRHRMADMIEKIKDQGCGNAFVYFDYMLPLQPEHVGRDNYPSRQLWEAFFHAPQWEIISHRLLRPQFEAAHVDLPVDHEHHWGHLFARRVADG
jgi:SAM-dependent methyltransferase